MAEFEYTPSVNAVIEMYGGYFEMYGDHPNGFSIFVNPRTRTVTLCIGGVPIDDGLRMFDQDIESGVDFSGVDNEVG